MRRLILLAAIVLSSACEGPVGPQGPAGPAGSPGAPGPQGPPGPGSRSLILDVPIAYVPLNDEDAIILEDSRVTPEGFRGIYLQVRDANVTTWFPFDYLMASSAAWTAEGELPAVILLRGGLLILDPKRSLLALSLVLQIMSDGGGRGLGRPAGGR